MNDDLTQLDGAPGPAQDDHTVLPNGTIIHGNYEILGFVGGGGMGNVYRAQNRFLDGDEVAIKTILPHLSRDSALREQIRLEAAILSRIKDPAIVGYRNFVEDEALGLDCLIMEFIAGSTLATWIFTAPLSAADVRRIFARLARSLHLVHEAGTYHRDLSPDNVMLRDDALGDAVLIDFGIAISDRPGTRAVTDQLVGKYRFMSPEHLTMDSRIGPASDVYSLALVIVAALRGKALNMGRDVHAAQDMRATVPDLSDVDAALRPLLSQMLDPDPEARPQSLAEVAENLQPSTGGRAGARPFGQVQKPKVIRSADAKASPPVAQKRYLVPVIAAAFAGLSGLAVLGAFVAFRSLPGAPSAPPVEPEKIFMAPPVPLPDPATLTRGDFYRLFPLGSCAVALRVARGERAGQVMVLGRKLPDLTDLRSAAATRFTAGAPNVAFGEVSPDQCVAVDFVRSLPKPRGQHALLALKPDGTGELRHAQGSHLMLLVIAGTGDAANLSGILTPTSGRLARFDLGPGASKGVAVLAIASERPLETFRGMGDFAADGILPLAFAEAQRDAIPIAADLHLLAD